MEICCDKFNMGMKWSFVIVFDQLFLKKSNKLDFEENRWLSQVPIKKALSRPSMNLWPIIYLYHFYLAMAYKKIID